VKLDTETQREKIQRAKIKKELALKKVARKNSTLLRIYVNLTVQNSSPTDKKEYDLKTVFVYIVVNRN
jgi:hypothetical protein